MIRSTAAAILAAGAGGISCRGGNDAPWLTALDRVTHDSKFPILTGAHQNADCDDCHGEFDTFREFSCTTECHPREETDPRHPGVSEYSWAPKSCFACHPRGEGLSRESHEQYFPITAATLHGQAACGECHTDPSDRTEIACNECHAHLAAETLAQHGAVGGYRHESTLCLRCHADAQVSRVASHQPFRIDSGSRHRAALAPCLDCHPAVREDKPWGAYFTFFDCRPCHSRGETDGEHDEVSGYAYDSPTCVKSGCHPRGEKEED